jgi:hypothetical protein
VTPLDQDPMPRSLIFGHAARGSMAWILMVAGPMCRVLLVSPRFFTR